MQKFKTLGVFFCIVLIAVFSACNKDEGLKGTYRSVDNDKNSLWFDYASKVQVNLDGEIFEGTYRITGKTVLITIDSAGKLLVLTRVNEKSLLWQHSSLQVFTKR
jgi:hypothetical protein